MGNYFSGQDPSHTPHNAQSVSSAPPSSSPSPGLSRPPSSVPHQRTTLQKHVTKPKTFYVPFIQRPVLDLSPSSTAPESVVKRALLSDIPSQNTIALVGMGGVGKSTILCALGRDKDIWAKFQDTVYFIELGHDITLSLFVRQLQQIVQSALPEFVEQFKELAASDDTHRSMISQLMDRLTSTRCLLLLDDVWDVNASVYNLVCVMSKAVEGNDNSLLKVLTSTRSRDIADELRTFPVSINPEELDTDKTLRIFCHHARVETSNISSLSPQNQNALNSIVETCAGLPLALSVAGSGVRQQMDPSSSGCDESAFGLYWERLKTKPRQVAGAEGGGGHKGLANALETSVQFLEERWESTKKTEELDDELGARDMFRSLCIMEKQKILPVCVIERLWGVSDVEAGVMMLSRNSLVSEVRERGQGVVGVRVHDLVLDLSVKMSEGGGGVMKWHGRLVDSFEVSGNGRTGENEIEEEEWWKLKKTDSEKYMREHVVRHLLGAGRINEAVKLLTDYRWIEEMNKDEERPAFRKVITEVEMLRKYLEREEEKTENVRRIVRDLSVIVRAMELCMMPYCVKNREECTYQLFGRLRDVVSESGIVERIVDSIERYGERPWARCGPGVLTSGRSWLRRVLKLENEGVCICAGTGEEVIVGGGEGEIWVLDGSDGTVKKTLDGHAGHPVVSVFFDRSTGLMYSCDGSGQVTIWKNEEKWRMIQVELEDEDKISCMLLLPSLQRVVLGTCKGRLLVMDIQSRSLAQTIAAHNDQVSSLAIGAKEGVMVSASWDRTIRLWHTESFEDTGAVFKGPTESVYSVALSADGRLLASASWDESVRVWDVQSGKQLWKSPKGQHYWPTFILFSGDGCLLYCADLEKTKIWRVSNGGREVSLVDTCPYLTTLGIKSLCLGDGSDLFALASLGKEVLVWDVRQVGNTIKSVSPFLPDVTSFGISEDGSTMVTFNWLSRLMEIRNVCDVSEHIDRVISSVTKSDKRLWPQPPAVSNDQRFVAYSHDKSCVVYIVESGNGNVLHSLPDLEEWALSFASAEQDEASNSSSSGGSNRRRIEQRRGIGTLSFSADGNIITACAAANPNPDENNRSVVHTKSMSWNVQSGEALDEAQLNCDSTAMSSTETPHLICNREFDQWSLEYSRNVTYCQGASSSTIATIEGKVWGAHYITDSSRLHLLVRDRGMYYTDLITDNTLLPLCSEPPLPIFPQSRPHPPRNTSTGTGADEVYDVFISHAGPDKSTIAQILYEILVALGFNVFLDQAELRPGQNAAEKMNRAMQTAKIAVVILSPEFAARKWTLKELMCFLERYEKGGEREIVIIPVFYRLTLNDCRNENTLFSLVDEKNESVFMKEGFLQRMAGEKGYGIGDVLKALQSLRSITGIENKNGVKNGESEGEKAGQRRFVEEIVKAIVEAKKRVDSGGGAGPSGAEV